MDSISPLNSTQSKSVASVADTELIEWVHNSWYQSSLACLYQLWLLNCVQRQPGVYEVSIVVGTGNVCVF